MAIFISQAASVAGIAQAKRQRYLELVHPERPCTVNAPGQAVDEWQPNMPFSALRQTRAQNVLTCDMGIVAPAVLWRQTASVSAMRTEAKSAPHLQPDHNCMEFVGHLC